jgi:hypothetical protein
MDALPSGSHSSVFFLEAASSPLASLIARGATNACHPIACNPAEEYCRPGSHLASDRAMSFLQAGALALAGIAVIMGVRDYRRGHRATGLKVLGLAALVLLGIVYTEFIRG